MNRFTIPLLLFASSHAYGIPPWAKSQGQSLNGNIYTVTCSGRGPAIDLARVEATRNCKLAASQVLDNEFQIKGMTIETEKDVAFHREIQNNATFKNLQCKPVREEFEQESTGSYTCWLQCQFDISQVNVTEKKDEKPLREPLSNSNLTSLSAKQVPKSEGNQISTRNQTITIISIPPCEDLLISGVKPRTHRCSGNPTTVIVNSDDESILVRSSGYVPKKIFRRTNEWESNSNIQVILEKK
jgi:hypothetical protein